MMTSLLSGHSTWCPDCLAIWTNYQNLELLCFSLAVQPLSPSFKLGNALVFAATGWNSSQNPIGSESYSRKMVKYGSILAMQPFGTLSPFLRRPGLLPGDCITEGEAGWDLPLKLGRGCIANNEVVPIFYFIVQQTPVCQLGKRVW